MDAQSDKLSARVGEPITIRLRSNPTTGIGWQATYDAQAVELIEKKFEREGPNVGAGGQDVLTFKPLRPGSVSVVLELRRPHEKGARETRTYELNVSP
jgi:predicted secreted protein